ncbi:MULTISPECIES: 2-oxo acid dehydrogenase subunit E2 [unclassified Oceanispirochaeta]|uniref:2-oxo acid dehydrogenase subunit E2 n=1 Tax=unclassified Oceanispirochaeta TaxID=2635722 RepID=UPI000E0956D1|nr:MULTISPECIES: 2-oxo acid dehydrogenase subunit E2 [unclassified Oceanispirochaeta]MBF9014120.1 2-oxo acid dehydrogenase subunit E2 [Oceanispirochaeta sp. M2]NPD70611.1 branched-chain alpha-keto acid dehydrogenase subunit E2 [Oceanispirochaeta sp. M1]RDG34376.1 branched-chain alpha-keto acid dehydrogenase subunit E2 [Oceanispirochaeta sp. M1]
MADIIEIRIPDLGSDDAVPVAEIFVKVGQEVEAEEALLALESDKAVMEIPSPVSGVIKEIKIKEGDKLKSGDLFALAELSSDSADSTAPADSIEAPPETDKSPAPPTVAAAAAKAPAPLAAPAPSKVAGGKKNHASPSVRRFARELGVDISVVEGTAPKGRITKEDIQNFVKELVKTGGGSGLPKAAYTDPSQFGSVTEEELTRIQKISGPHLHGSWVNIPHVTQYEQADISYLETWRKELNAKGSQGVKFSVLAFVVKALYKAMEEFPRFNSVLAPEGDRLYIRNYYNIGIAVDTPQGLLVPVIKDVDQKNLTEIVASIKDLALRGRDGKLKAADLQGAGISISNLGGIGGTSFTPIINPPEVAILGLSRSAMQPVWNGEEFQPRLMLPMSLSYDHRVIDGAMAARFVRHLADLLEDMKKILL